MNGGSHFKCVYFAFPPAGSSNALSCVMHHGSAAEWSVVGARGGCGQLGGGSCNWSGVMVGKWAAGSGYRAQRPHCPAAGLCAVAALRQLSGVGIISYTHT